MDIILIGLGGFIGALGRYGLSLLANRLPTTLPLGTLVVNLVGCFMAGILLGLFERRLLVDPGLRVFLMVGFLGAFTTFSAFSLESLGLLRTGQLVPLGLNVAAQVLGGLLFVYLGQLIVGD